MLLKVHVYGKELLKTVSGPHFLFDKNWIDWCFTYACEYFTHIWSSQEELLKGCKNEGYPQHLWPLSREHDYHAATDVLTKVLGPVGIQVKAGAQSLLLVIKGNLNNGGPWMRLQKVNHGLTSQQVWHDKDHSIWDLKKRGLMSQQIGHDKEHFSLLKGHSCWTDIDLNFAALTK